MTEEYQQNPTIQKAMEQAATLRRTLSELVYDDIDFAMRCSMSSMLHAADEMIYDLDAVARHHCEEAGERPRVPLDREFKGHGVGALVEQLARLPVGHPLVGFKLDDSYSDRSLWLLVREHDDGEDERMGYFTWTGMLDHINVFSTP